MSIPISQFIPPPPPPALPPLVSIRLFSTSVSLFLPCKLVHLYHFSRFHIYALIYDICFSLSDLLHSVWQSLGPFTSLQMTHPKCPSTDEWIKKMWYIYTMEHYSVIKKERNWVICNKYLNRKWICLKWIYTSGLLVNKW